ncbi:hypothetical protein D3C86_1964010 [compost metagenome]
MLVQQATDRLRGAVAPGKAGATGDQHHLHAFIGDPAGHLGADLVQVVLEQRPGHQTMTHVHRAAGQQLAGGIGLERTGIADRQYGNIQRNEHGIGFGTHILAL